MSKSNVFTDFLLGLVLIMRKVEGNTTDVKTAAEVRELIDRIHEAIDVKPHIQELICRQAE